MAELKDNRTMESLRGQAEFDPIFASGRKASVGCAMVRALSKPGAASSRLGLIVPKTKAKLAVERNAFKRVAREAARAFFASLPDGMAADLVVQLAHSPGEASIDEFKAKAAEDARKAIEAAYALASKGPQPTARALPDRKPAAKAAKPKR